MISIPFAWTHESVEEITVDSQDWIGSIGEGYEWYYADYMLLLTFGGIPWQVMYLNTSGIPKYLQTCIHEYF